MQFRCASIALLLAAAGCASGPPGPPGGPGGEGPMRGGTLQDGKIARPVALLFAYLDANQDLVLSKAELEEAIPREFSRADTDTSGILTGFEVTDWCLRMMGDREAQPDLRTMDNDVNYTVTEQEFAVALRHEFERMDANQDGNLARAEMLMDAPRMQMGAPAGGGQQGGQGQQRGGRGGRGGGPGGGPGGGQPPF